VIALALAPFAGSYTAYAAFGISPPFINADHLVPGAVYRQTVYLVQDRPEEDLPMKAVLEISDSIRSWISLDRGFDFTIPKGTRQFPVEVVVRVPEGTSLGVYKGNLTFTGAPGKAGQVTIALGAQAVMNLTVGDNIYRKVSIPLVKFLDIEEGWSPRVYLKLNNEGNVPEELDGATFELLDQYGAVRLAFSQTPRGLTATPPFEISEYTVEFPMDLHLGLGQYWGVVTFYQDGKQLVSQKGVFNVLKAGSIVSPSERLLGRIFTNVLGVPLWYFIALIIGLGIGWLLWWWRRARVRA
jgi:hypothetical protein